MIVEAAMAALISLANAAPALLAGGDPPPAAPLVRPQSSWVLVKGSESDLTITSIDPRAIALGELPQRRVAITMKGTTGGEMQIARILGPASGSPQVQCTYPPGSFTCTFVWTDPTDLLFIATHDSLTFGVGAVPTGALLPPTVYSIRIPIIHKETKKPLVPGAPR